MAQLVIQPGGIHYRNLIEGMNLPVNPVTRRYSQRPFPAYRYVPGKAPHPTRDPEGHSWNKPMEQLDSFDVSQWQSCEEYLYGIDLFNHSYWWEAHEALEAVWVTAGRTTETGLFIQGLIQIAVAHLKNFQGFTDVTLRMAQDGLDKMKWIKGYYLGIDVDKFRKDVETFSTGDAHSSVIIELNVDD